MITNSFKKSVAIVKDDANINVSPSPTKLSSIKEVDNSLSRNFLVPAPKPTVYAVMILIFVLIIEIIN